MTCPRCCLTVASVMVGGDLLVEAARDHLPQHVALEGRESGNALLDQRALAAASLMQ